MADKVVTQETWQGAGLYHRRLMHSARDMWHWHLKEIGALKDVEAERNIDTSVETIESIREPTPKRFISPDGTINMDAVDRVYQARHMLPSSGYSVNIDISLVNCMFRPKITACI